MLIMIGPRTADKTLLLFLSEIYDEKYVNVAFYDIY